MKKTMLLTAVIALVTATAATAATPTPTQYRSKLNGICRDYTPKLSRLESSMAQTQTATDQKAFFVAAGKYLALGLAQDVKLETEAVPTALRARMTPIVSRLKKIDVHVRAALAAANASNMAAMNRELLAIGTLSAPLDKWLDAAGLRDCGSKQQ